MISFATMPPATTVKEKMDGNKYRRYLMTIKFFDFSYPSRCFVVRVASLPHLWGDGAHVS